jgi:hypothetical protein
MVDLDLCLGFLRPLDEPAKLTPGRHIAKGFETFSATPGFCPRGTGIQVVANTSKAH